MKPPEPGYEQKHDSISPLRKRRLKDGALYARVPQVEAKLIELSALSPERLVGRCSIREEDDSGYVPSECVLYFVRAMRTAKCDAHFELLYKILVERVLRRLPKPTSANGESQSLTRTLIRDQVFDRFVDLLVLDRNAYSEKLDYFEIRFDDALKSLRVDAQEKFWREENRAVPLEVDPETGEISAEVEEASGSFDPFDPAGIHDAAYRLRLDAAIDALNPDYRRIIQMLRLGFPIDSKDPGTITIAKALKKSEKTIRTYRDKAFADLRATLGRRET